MRGGLQRVQLNNDVLLLTLGFTEDEIEMVEPVQPEQLINTYLEVLQNRHPGMTLEQVGTGLSQDEKSEIVEETLNHFYEEIAHVTGGRKNKTSKKKSRKNKTSKKNRKTRHKRRYAKK